MSSPEKSQPASSEAWANAVSSSEITMPSSPTHKPSSTNNAKSHSEEKSKLSNSAQETTNPRLAALLSKKTNLQTKLAALQAERAALAAETKLPSGLAMPANWSDEEKLKQALTSSNAVIKEHIALLHQYNEIKDIGQGLMGMIAEGRGVRVGVVQEEFGLGERD